MLHGLKKSTFLVRLQYLVVRAASSSHNSKHMDHGVRVKPGRRREGAAMPPRG